MVFLELATTILYILLLHCCCLYVSTEKGLQPIVYNLYIPYTYELIEVFLLLIIQGRQYMVALQLQTNLLVDVYSES